MRARRAAPGRRDPAGAEERALLAVQDQVSNVRQAICVADEARLPVDVAEVQRRVSRVVVVDEYELLAKRVLEVGDVALMLLRPLACRLKLRFGSCVAASEADGVGRNACPGEYVGRAGDRLSTR
jgi:hypothetical protein